MADTLTHWLGPTSIEYLTDEICRRAMEYIQKIDDLGGALAAIENKGYMQGEIQDSAYRYQQAVENKEQVVVGVNAFQIRKNGIGTALRGSSIETNTRRRACKNCVPTGILPK